MCLIYDQAVDASTKVTLLKIRARQRRRGHPGHRRRRQGGCRQPAGLPAAQRDGTKYHFRPCFIEPYRCERVLIEGVTVRNSPFWHLHPTLCQDVTVRGVTVNSSGPNTDGCDPECCDGVLIDGVSFNCGDDCIAIKSGRNADGRRVNIPSQNIVIQDCAFANGHGGVTVGSEMTGGVRNVYARDLTITSAGLQSGHRLKTNSVRGGFIENTNVWRASVTAIGGPLLLIDYNYGEGNTGSYPPVVNGVTLSEWSVASAAQGWDIAGYATDPVGTVTLRDVTIASASVARYLASEVGGMSDYLVPHCLRRACGSSTSGGGVGEQRVQRTAICHDGQAGAGQPAGRVRDRGAGRGRRDGRGLPRP